MKGIGLYNLDFFKRKTDNDLIKESVTRILLTSKGERVNNPEFGSNLQRFLFSNASFHDIEEEIFNSIARWEPRVSITNISTEWVSTDSIKVLLEFFNRESAEDFTYEITLKY